MNRRSIAIVLCSLAAATAAPAGDGNRLTYLDELNPWHPNLGFPKLATPQWVGEDGVEAVVILAIDDMRDPAKYERYLRPILSRLKQIDGRAPVSIMTNTVRPDDPQLRQWLDEGLSIECHTIDHPCPLLQGGDFAKAKSTYDRCVDLMHEIPGNKPVAFRIPCCDSLNTVSPRFYAEIFSKTTEKGHFLQADSSVFNVFTSDDPEIPRELVLEGVNPSGPPPLLKGGQGGLGEPSSISSRSEASSEIRAPPPNPPLERGGAGAPMRERFRKYLPRNLKRGDKMFDTFVNWIENYPYPYVIGNTCWEFPCVVPSDWEAQHLHGVNNPETVADWKAALDITVLKQGVFCLVFHPHGWIKPEQVVELIDHAQAQHGKKVKFLTFREAVERLNEQLLLSRPLRDPDGRENGVRLLDLDDDGFVDVMSSEKAFVGSTLIRRWDQTRRRFAAYGQTPSLRAMSAGLAGMDGLPILVGTGPDGWRIKAFDHNQWTAADMVFARATNDVQRRIIHQPRGFVRRIRLRDLDGDGWSELLVYHRDGLTIWRQDKQQRTWRVLPFSLPDRLHAAKADEMKAGLRFVDINEDGHDDVVFSNHERYSVHLWVDRETGWSRTILEGTRNTASGRREPAVESPPLSKGGEGGLAATRATRDESEASDKIRATPPGPPLRRGGGDEGQREIVLPPIVRADGTDTGFFGHWRHLFWQNEDTADLADLVYRVSFDELLKDERPGPKTPKASLNSIEVPPGFKVELVAAEPLVIDPVAFEWGPDGRLWVVEMGDYPLGVTGDDSLPQSDDSPADPIPPGGRVRYLEDTDGDGRYDKSTLFLDGLNYPSGILPWRNGVLVSNAPKIIYAEDTDGDGRADLRVTLLAGFGEGNQQHRVNGLVYGLDNWVHCANGDSNGVVRVVSTVPNPPPLPKGGQGGLGENVGPEATVGATPPGPPLKGGGGKVGTPLDRKRASLNLAGRDFRFKPDTGEIELVSGRSQFGRNRDDWGHWFGCNNSNPMWHFPLIERYLNRNPHLAPPDPRVPVSVDPGAAPCYPVSRPMPRFNDFDRLNRFTSACSAMIYRDELFGPEFLGNSFVSEPVHNLVHREIVRPAGVTFTSRRAEGEQHSEFLASRDNWFRPTMIKTGPDGALWIADMYRLVIEHPEYIPKHFWKEWDFRAGDDRGRIYRVLPREAAGRPTTAPRLDRLSTAGLVAALNSPGGWQRDTAQRLLVESQDPSAIPHLKKLLAEAQRPLARLHALCTLDGLGALTPELLHAALGDQHPGVRRHAVRLSEPFLRRPKTSDNIDLGSAVGSLADDPDAFVRMQVAFTLGEWKSRSAGEALAAIALREPGDEYLTTAVLSSVNTENLRALVTAALRAAPRTEATSQFLDRLLAQAGRIGTDRTLVGVLQVLTEPDSNYTFQPWQMRATARLLESLERRGLDPDRLFNADRDDEIRSNLKQMLHGAHWVVTDMRHEYSEDQRLAAIELLPLDDVVVTSITAIATLLQPQVSGRLQSAAVDALGRMDDRGLPEGHTVPVSILAGWKSLGPEIRTAALDVLLSRERWTLALLTYLDQGVIAVGEVDAARRQRLLNHNSAAIRRQAEQIFDGRIDPDRQKLIDDYYATAARGGDVAAGRQVFNKACATCHRLEGPGHEVGPDLAALKDKSVQSLLVAILDPNRAVESKYVAYTAVTQVGRQHSGLLAAEAGNSITLAGPENKRVTLLRSDLEELVSTSKSTMPEGLEKDLSPRDVADVIAYLRVVGQSSREME